MTICLIQVLPYFMPASGKGSDESVWTGSSHSGCLCEKNENLRCADI